MRATAITRFGDADVLDQIDLPTPESGAGEVAIDVHYAGLNYAEVLYRRGLVDVPLPFVPGIEVSGHIRALGDGVLDLAAGQRVAALTIVAGGGYGQVVVADSRLVVPVPEDMDLALAACVPSNTTTAILVMRQIARAASGESVLVHAAAGGVGSQFGQAARLVGAGPVIGVVGSREKIEAAQSYGYDEVVVRSDLSNAADRLTHGEGFDVIIDPVGGHVRETAVDMLAVGGRLVVMGNASAAEDVGLSANALWFGGQAALGFNLAALTAAQPSAVGGALHKAIEAVSSSQIRVGLTEVLPISQVASAHRRLEAGQTVGKIALRLDGGR